MHPAPAAAAVAAAKNDVAQKAGAAFAPIAVGVDGGILKTGEYIPAEVAIAIAAKQDAAIKNGVK